MEETPLKHWQIVQLLAVYGKHFGLPAGGRFFEDGQQFVFEPPASNPDAHLAVPRRIVVSGEELEN